MFALIETTHEGNIFRKITHIFSRKAEISEDISFGVRILRVKIPVSEDEKKNTGRMRAAAEEIMRRGIKKAVFHEGFQYKDAFAGLREPDRLPMYKENAFSLCVKALGENTPANLKTVVYARRFTRDIERVVLELCGITRHIFLDIGQGAEGFIRMLRRDYGVAVVERRIHSPDIAVGLFLMFDKPEIFPQELKNNTVIIALHDEPEYFTDNVITGAEFEIPEDLKSALPDGFDSQVLIAALFESGIIKRLKITELISKPAINIRIS